MESKYRFEEGKFTEGPLGRTNYVLKFPNKTRDSYDGPLVLCFHGLLSSLSSFKQLETKCIESNLAVLRIDMPGHGLSSWKYFGKLTIDDFIKQIDSVLLNLDLNKLKLYLVGTSMGGLISICYAGKYPEKVLKVAALCPAGFCKPLSTSQKIAINYFPKLFQLFESTFPTYLLANRENYLNDYFDSSKIDPELIDLKLFRYKYYGRQMRTTFARVITGFDFWNNEEAFNLFIDKYISLRGFNGVCFYLGLHDEIVPIDTLLLKLKSLVPKSRAIIYKECKHQVIDEGDQILIDIMKYFDCKSLDEYLNIGLSIESIKIKDNY